MKATINNSVATMFPLLSCKKLDFNLSRKEKGHHSIIHKLQRSQFTSSMLLDEVITLDPEWFQSKKSYPWEKIPPSKQACACWWFSLILQFSPWIPSPLPVSSPFFKKNLSLSLLSFTHGHPWIMNIKLTCSSTPMRFEIVIYSYSENYRCVKLHWIKRLHDIAHHFYCALGICTYDFTYSDLILLNCVDLLGGQLLEF